MTFISVFGGVERNVEKLQRVVCRVRVRGEETRRLGCGGGGGVEGWLNWRKVLLSILHCWRPVGVRQGSRRKWFPVRL